MKESGGYRSPNFSRIDIVANILHRGSRDIEFAQLPYFPFLRSLRAPSEATHFAELIKDGLTGFDPTKGPEIIGIRRRPTNHRLSVRFSRRKNTPGGFVLSRTCFFSLSEPEAKNLCHVRAIWHCIASRVRSGGLLPRRYSAIKLNTNTRAALSKIGIEHSQSNTSHGFRLGATDTRNEKGPHRSVVATVGLWRSLAFLGYVYTALDVAKDMSRLLIETEAPSDEEVRSLGDGIPR